MDRDKIPVIQRDMMEGLYKSAHVIRKYEPEAEFYNRACYDHDQADFYDRFMRYKDFIFDLVRYGSSNHDLEYFKDFRKAVRARAVPLHPVRERHPKGIIIA